MREIKRSLPLLVLVLAILTRFVNIGWGLPYPFHPDERNMADALMNLHCDMFTGSPVHQFTECFNPHFYAYGQLPLYLGYLGIQLFQFVTFKIGEAISFSQAVLSLRIISALASLATIFVATKIVRILSFPRGRESSSGSPIQSGMTALLLIFSPGLIQMAHFGTTESLLMLLYSSLILLSLFYVNKHISVKRFVISAGIAAGVSIGVKVSSGIFIAVPLLALLLTLKKKKPLEVGKSSLLFGIVTILSAFCASPYNFLSPQEFLGSMQYESGVALGTIPVFYTRQFFESIPVVFQFIKTFPYALGMIVTSLSVTGFLFLPRNKNYLLLRFAFLVYFLPTAFLFTKWTRFMAPVFPVMIIFGVLFVQRLVGTGRDLSLRSVITYLLMLLMILPGVQYLSVYLHEDVRVSASKWMFKNIPSDSLILSESANVVDLPLGANNYRVLSFNFYDVDRSEELQRELEANLRVVQYIIIPSRRVYANHTCISVHGLAYTQERCKKLQKLYPVVNNYYQRLLSGESGFKSAATFQVLNDNAAEETWNVFDHPAIQIFERK